VVFGNKEARKRLTDLNGSPAMDIGLGTDHFRRYRWYVRSNNFFVVLPPSRRMMNFFEREREMFLASPFFKVNLLDKSALLKSLLRESIFKREQT